MSRKKLVATVAALALSLVSVTFTPIAAQATVNAGCETPITNSGIAASISDVEITSYGVYCVARFLTVSDNYSFTVPSGISTLDYLVVAGGGGGGSGGGGGGGLLQASNYPVTSGDQISVSVGRGGTGGAGGRATQIPGTKGVDSSFGPIIAKGGGAGGTEGIADYSNVNGGSGGGSGGPGIPVFFKNLGVGVILAAALLVWLGTGFFIVQEGQQAVITQFGKYHSTVGAGFNWRMPYPIQRHELVFVTQIRSVDIGRDNIIKATGLRESAMLTEDENIVEIKFAVQYRLNDARAYLFESKNPTEAVVQSAETAVREVVGKMKMDSALAEERDQIAPRVREKMQTILDRYKVGIEVVGIIEKHRGWCRIVELYAMGGDPPRMLNLQRGDGGGAPGGHLYSRPEGVQAVGPWTIYPAPPPGTPVTIHAGHDCGMPWLTHTVLLRLDHS